MLLPTIVFAHRYTYRCATRMPEMHIGRSALMRLLHHTIYINMYITNCSWRDMNRIAMWQLFCLLKLPYNCDSVTVTAHVRWVQGEPKQEQCDVFLIKLCNPCLYIRMSKPVIAGRRTFTVTAPVLDKVLAPPTKPSFLAFKHTQPIWDTVENPSGTMSRSQPEAFNCQEEAPVKHMWCQFT